MTGISSRLWALLFSVGLLTAAGKAFALPPLPQAESGPAPVWVEDPRLQFPRTDYLFRRGTGASAEAAAQQAYDKIATLFGAGPGQPLPDEIEQALEIAAIWHDTANGRYRAIATLDQNTAEDFLRRRITTLDDATERALKALETRREPIVRIGLVAQALNQQKAREKFQKAMKKVDVTARGIPPRWKIDALEEQLEGYITALVILPAGDASDVPLDQMAEMIARGLKVARINRAASAKEADYILKGRLAISHAPDESGWMGGQGRLELDLYAPEGNTPIGHHQWAIDVIHLYPETAERRVVEKAEYLLKKEMRDVIIDMGRQALINLPAP